MPLNWEGMAVIRQYPGSPEAALESLGTEGLNEQVTAGLLGVTEDEFLRELGQNPSWQAAWDHGRAVAKAILLQSLWRAGRTGDADAAKVWLLGLLV